MEMWERPDEDIAASDAYTLKSDSFSIGLRFLLGFQKQSAPKTTPRTHTESV